MTNNKVQFSGSACAHHGSYSFFKGLRYTGRDSKPRILALGEFFLLKVWEDDDIVSIGEPQLIWEDRASNNMLVSLRLYFMPENTPEGRTEEHGEHEVICLSEKVVMKAEDLVTLIRTPEEVKWNIGLRGVYGSQPNAITNTSRHNQLTVTNRRLNNNNNTADDDEESKSPPPTTLIKTDIKTETHNNINDTSKTEPAVNNIKTETDLDVRTNNEQDSINNKKNIKQEIKMEQDDTTLDEKHALNNNNSCMVSVRSSSRNSLNSCLPETMYYPPPVIGGLDIREIRREKKLIGDVIGPDTIHPMILTYDRYCRIRSQLKRLGDVEESMRSMVVQALGGFLSPSKNTLMLFCRDIFDYPELEVHELLCNHLSPKLQGRPRKKHKKRIGGNNLNSSVNNNSESESSEETVTGEDSNSMAKPKLKNKPGLSIPVKPGLAPNKPNSLRAMDRKAKPSSSIMTSAGAAMVSGSLSSSNHHGYGRAGGGIMAGAGNMKVTNSLHHKSNMSTHASGKHHMSLNTPDNKHHKNKNYTNSLQAAQNVAVSAAAVVAAAAAAAMKQSHASSPDFDTPALNRLIEADFMSKLHKFMRDRKTPITRVPHIGYRQLNVFELFSKVQQLGGYEAVSANQQWKLLYDQLAGPQLQQQTTPTAAANTIKRHYERLLYPYEKFLLLEQKRLYGTEALKQSIIGQSATSIMQGNNSSKKNNHHSESEPSVSILQGGFQAPSTSPPPSTPPVLPPPTGLAPPPPLPSPHHLTVPKVAGQKKDPGPHPSGGGGSLPSDLAKRPEITITPIPRSSGIDPLSGGANALGILSAAAAAAAAATGNNGLPASAAMKALGLDSLSGLDLSMLDINTLAGLADLAKKVDGGIKSGVANPLGILNAATAAALVVGGTPTSSSSLTCEPAPKRFKPDDNSRLNGARDGNRYQDRGLERGNSSSLSAQHQLSLQTAAELTKLQQQGAPIPELLPAEVLRSLNMLDDSSPGGPPQLLLPAHQSTKTINALAALLPHTSIFPAPAAHQQSSTRSPLKNSHLSGIGADSPRPEPPKVFQSQNLYTQGSRMYDKPTADILIVPSTSSGGLQHMNSSASSKAKECNSQASRERKNSSPEIQILDLSQPSHLGNNSNNNYSGKHNSGGGNGGRLDVELLDLSTRRDITVSAVPKSSKISSSVSSRAGSSNSNQGILRPPLDGITITPSSRSFTNRGNNSSSNSIGNLGVTSAELTNLMGMQGAALMAAAASQSLPPGLAGLGLGSPGSLPPGAIPPSLLPFLMSTSGGSSSHTNKSSLHPPTSSSSNNNSAANATAAAVAAAGLPPMFSPYFDPASLAAYYSNMVPSVSSSGTSTTGGVQQASPNSPNAALAAVQMAHLHSLGIHAHAPPPPPTTLSESLANLGMYKNFLGGAAAAAAAAGGLGVTASSAAATPASSASNMIPPPHFLAALMSSATAAQQAKGKK